ncbi:hypothetical protein MTR_3g498845 [Medicago truncatula]|uniref:Uncharacterized protein n=1 Tax=Medicago truncatula TaxID=3880 RepID=A0A072VC00_MEDTR|nr:hypothetical protein MTR_3g498845 [Medicago truncatula]
MSPSIFFKPSSSKTKGTRPFNELRGHGHEANFAFLLPGWWDSSDNFDFKTSRTPIKGGALVEPLCHIKNKSLQTTMVMSYDLQTLH